METADRAQASAQRLQPLGWGLFGLVLVGVALGDVLEPMLQAVQSARPGGSKTVWEAAQWVSLELVRASPSAALVYSVWSGQRYLQRLSRGEVWDVATPELLGRIGTCLIWAAALRDLIVPTALRWLRAQGGFDLQLSTLSLVLAALGALLLLIARILRDVLETERSLKTETDGFV